MAKRFLKMHESLDDLRRIETGFEKMQKPRLLWSSSSAGGHRGKKRKKEREWVLIMQRQDSQVFRELSSHGTKARKSHREKEREEKMGESLKKLRSISA